MSENCDRSYDKGNSQDKKGLLDIPFLKKHPSYLPYIGTEYRESDIKILQVGNCHYIEQSQDPERRYDFKFFKSYWFDGSNCSVLPTVYNLKQQMSGCPQNLNWQDKRLTCENAWNDYCLNTRSLVGEMFLARRDKKNLCGNFKPYPIFGLSIWALGCACQEILGFSDTDRTKISFPKDNESEIEEYKQKINPYKYVAYTDFHFFPSLFRGEAKVKDSLIDVAIDKIIIDLICGVKNDPRILHNSNKTLKLSLKNGDKELSSLTKTNAEDIIYCLIENSNEAKNFRIPLDYEQRNKVVKEIELSLITGNNEEVISKCNDVNTKVSEAKEFYKEIVDESFKILDEIVGIIKPDLIWLTCGDPVLKFYDKERNKYSNLSKTKTLLDYHPNHVKRNKDDKNKFRDNLIKYVKDIRELKQDRNR